MPKCPPESPTSECMTRQGSNSAKRAYIRVMFTREGLTVIGRTDLEDLCWGLLQRRMNTQSIFLEDKLNTGLK